MIAVARSENANRLEYKTPLKKVQYIGRKVGNDKETKNYVLCAGQKFSPWVKFKSEKILGNANG